MTGRADMDNRGTVMKILVGGACLIIVFLALSAILKTGKTRPGGIGVVLDIDNGTVKVVAPIDGYPAQQAGILPGDVILMVDGEPAEGNDMAELAAGLRGPAGTNVALDVYRPSDGVERTYVIERGTIPITEANRAQSGGIGIVYNVTADGLAVVGLYPGRSADKAGVKVGDIITEVDGAGVFADEYRGRIGQVIMGPYAGSEIVGTRVNITVRRSGKELDFELARDIDAPKYVGAGIRMSQAEDSIVVSYVLPGKPADKSGIMAGDRIVAVDNKPVESPEQARKLLSGGSAGETLKVKVMRPKQQGGMMEFNVTLERIYYWEVVKAY